MFQPSPKVPRQIKEKDFKVIRRRRKVKLEDAQRIFYLRHRSHDDSNRIWLSYQEISKVLNLPTMTCYNALRKYKRENMKYENLYKQSADENPIQINCLRKYRSTYLITSYFRNGQVILWNNALFYFDSRNKWTSEYGRCSTYTESTTYATSRPTTSISKG